MCDVQEKFGSVFTLIFFPTVFSQLVGMAQEVTNLIFIGQLNEPAMLAGVGLGNVIMNVLGLSVIFGMNGALETLVSQAYGRGNLQLCGVYLRRGRLIMTLFFIPIAVILSQVNLILQLIGQDKMVAMYAQQYTLAFLPGMYLCGLFDA